MCRRRCVPSDRTGRVWSELGVEKLGKTKSRRKWWKKDRLGRIIHNDGSWIRTQDAAKLISERTEAGDIAT
jgi:hypothetical protein